jgi:alkylhydroperoxidase family enzyme
MSGEAHAGRRDDDEQITALVSLVALIDAANRLAVMAHQPAGAPDDRERWG